MRKNSSPSRWKKLSKFYAELSEFYTENFPDTYIGLIIILSLLWSIVKSFIPASIVAIPLLSLAFIFHHYVVPKMVEEETYPSQVLLFFHLRQSYLKVSIVCFPLIYLITRGRETGILDSLVAQFSQYVFEFPPLVSLATWAILALIEWFFWLIVMMFIFSMIPFGVRPHKMARLSLLSAITGLRKVRARSLELSRLGIVDRHVKWLRKGFQRCNDFLLQEPYRIGVKNIDQYYERVFSTTLVGRENEIKEMSNYLDNMLTSLGRKEIEFDLSNFLKSLKYVSNKKVRELKLSQDLGEMIFIRASVGERVKAKIKSPYTTSIVAIISMLITLIALIIQALK